MSEHRDFLTAASGLSAACLIPYYRLFLIVAGDLLMLLVTFYVIYQDLVRSEGARGPAQSGDVRMPRHRYGAESTC